ncbi:MAG: UDP-N-acetylmuramoyl-L-alanyl-D-glutamate--2,6-diaminopimelate ligase [Actinomycetota bacterium]
MAAKTPPARPLSDLVARLAAYGGAGHEIRGDAVHVVDVADRSDRVLPGALFFCVPGATADGHAFAPEAVARGASSLVVERWLEDLPVTQVLVGSVRAAMGPMSAAFFGSPSARISLVGITGTNGKTTTTYLLESIFATAGRIAGLIGTTGARVAGAPVRFERTTPEAPALQRVLWEMAETGVNAAAMEVSSHGLEQHRVDGTRFAIAVFTNLSQDHLDYHGSMESYFTAKARLFTPSFADRAAIDVDDPYGRRLVETSVPARTFGTIEEAELRATDIRVEVGGIRFRVDGIDMHSPLRGAFNVGNCLAAIAAARELGIDDAAIARGIATMPGVPGRVDPVDEGQDFLVLVDYAHTPDGVENVLRAARSLADGRVVIVVGCGGDRDREKRPLMGRAATSLADLTILTSDNPRSEDPLAILAEIEPGAKAGGGAYEVEPDRRAAIRRAVRSASTGDVLVVAGKGHETGQEFADRTVPFDDRSVAAEELRARLDPRGEPR